MRRSGAASCSARSCAARRCSAPAGSQVAARTAVRAGAASTVADVRDHRDRSRAVRRSSTGGWHSRRSPSGSSSRPRSVPVVGIALAVAGAGAWALVGQSLASAVCRHDGRARQRPLAAPTALLGRALARDLRFRKGVSRDRPAGSDDEPPRRPADRCGSRHHCPRVLRRRLPHVCHRPGGDHVLAQCGHVPDLLPDHVRPRANPPRDLHDVQVRGVHLASGVHRRGGARRPGAGRSVRSPMEACRRRVADPLRRRRVERRGRLVARCRPRRGSSAARAEQDGARVTLALRRVRHRRAVGTCRCRLQPRGRRGRARPGRALPSSVASYRSKCGRTS